MSVWNHRVVRRKYPGAFNEVLYAIHEAHYYNQEGEGSPRAITVDQIAPMSEDLEGLRWTLERMLKALDRPVLDYETREELP